jgi:hypothetical protein
MWSPLLAFASLLVELQFELKINEATKSIKTTSGGAEGHGGMKRERKEILQGGVSRGMVG